MQLDLDQLRTFAIAAETLNFSLAGKQLGRVQSAISTQILRLEETTGERLFDRGRGRSMKLTPAGERLLVHAQRMLSLNVEALRSVRRSRAAEKVRFGTTETYAITVMSSALSLFAAIEPDVDIEVVCAPSAELLRKLDDGELDLAMITDQGRRDRRRLVRREPLVWVAGASFGVNDSGPIPVGFMPAGCEFRHAGIRALEGAGLNWSMVVSSPSPTGIRAALLAGIAVSVMPKAAVDDRLTVLTTKDGLPALGSVSVVIHDNGDDQCPQATRFGKVLATVFGRKGRA